MDHLHALEHATVSGQRYARIVGYTSLTVLICIVIAVASVLDKHGYSEAKLAWDVATVFVLCAVPISTKDIQDHLIHFEIPELQKYEVRILFMVPIYALTSWVCLWNENNVLYRFMDAFRSLYEAYVIWNFTYFLCGFLGPTEETLAARLEDKPQEPHLWPVKWFLRPWRMGHEFLLYTKGGTLQYVFWKILNVFIVLMASLLGIYRDGEWTPWSVYFWLTGITNLSQMLALYCLVLFYHATYKDLASIIPLAKFLCIKLVVFFSFWQGCFISALVYFGAIKDTPYFPNAATTLQDFIVCIEMLFFAIAHHYAFSYKDFARISHDDSGVFPEFTVSTTTSDGSSAHGSSFGSGSAVRALLEAANPRDLFHDIGQNIRRMRHGSHGGSFRVSTFDSDEDNSELGRSAAISSSGMLDSVPLSGRDFTIIDGAEEEAYAYEEMGDHEANQLESDVRMLSSAAETSNNPTHVL